MDDAVVDCAETRDLDYLVEHDDLVSTEILQSRISSRDSLCYAISKTRLAGCAGVTSGMRFRIMNMLVLEEKWRGVGFGP
jgi:hypothetical protein